jgi:hypothetical protein
MDNIVNLRFEDTNDSSYFDMRHRTWEVISVDQYGRAFVYEYGIVTRDENGDGEISEDESGNFITPRINIFQNARKQLPALD